MTDRLDDLTTVSVPEPFRAPFLEAQRYVAQYFGDKVEDPEHSTITISGERYILVRAASMSVEFYDLVMSLYAERGPEEARSVASNLLFDIAHAIGKSDARAFHARMHVTDPIARLSAGPVHFSFSGWAFVDILPESAPSPDENFFLLYDHPFSFESDAWRRRGTVVDFPVCIMNAGYSSGWCEESFGIPLVSVEVACQARGDPHCRFIMAPPGRIEQHLARFTGAGPVPARSASPTIPEFFQRKRMEEALRASKESLERRVAERTDELARANQALQLEMAERTEAEAQRRQIETQMHHAQKLESLGVLAGGIAHDFNNLLVGILGNASLVLADLPADSEHYPAIKDIETAAVRAADLVRQMLAYAGKGMLAPELVDLNRLVTETARLIGSAVSKKARLEFRLSAGLPQVLADATQLRQVAMNLITNASDSLEGKPGDIVITTGLVTVTDSGTIEALPGEQVTAGPHVFLEVSDTGCGMDSATQARVFEPFFTTKFAGRGLGLAAVLGIVRRHQGVIRLTSHVGRGTRIRVLLPGNPDLAEGLGPPAPAEQVGRPADTGIILIVDDEETVQRVLRRILERQGFEVRQARDGAEAIEIFRADPNRIRAVLLDLNMPRMNGRETLDGLRRICPGVKVILSSGLAEEEAVGRFGVGGADAFLQKPYRAERFLDALHQLLVPSATPTRDQAPPGP